MQSPLALVLDDDPEARDRARDALERAGIEAIAVSSLDEALDAVRAHPLAVVVAVVGDAPTAAPSTLLLELCRRRAYQAPGDALPIILGRSQAAETLARRVAELAATRAPVLFFGEPGSGRWHAARSLHALSSESDPFVVVSSRDQGALERALRGGRGTVFVASIEELPWPAQEFLAAALSAGTSGPRIAASIGVDPHRAANEGRLLSSLVAGFSASIVPVPPLRERRADIALLVRAFLEELRRLNRLGPLEVAPHAMAALERFEWPGNLSQLRGVIESAVMLASDGTVRLKDLPEELQGGAASAGLDARADRRFREAKRQVVDAFERSYLEALLKRHGGNVTGAAEHSGMLRSALQRLLRKHEIHSADFRGREATDPIAT